MLFRSGSPDGSVKLWDVASGTLLWSGWHTKSTTWLAFAPNGSRLTSASYDGTVKLWEVGETGSRRCLETLVGHTERVQALAWSADGGTLASGSFDHTIRLWDGQEGNSRLVLQGHSAVVNGLAFTPDSRSLLIFLTPHSSAARFFPAPLQPTSRRSCSGDVTQR